MSYKRVTSPMGEADADADSYLPLMHMDVSCDVEVKWLTQDPAGKTFAFAPGVVAESFAFFVFFPFFSSPGDDAEAVLVLDEEGKTVM
jgi:hypothetical protein